MRQMLTGFTTLLCLSLPLCAQAADTLTKIRKTQTLVIGIRETAPFSYTDADKQPLGYSVDLCLKVADAIKKRIKDACHAAAILSR
ncbi:hypothetical protein ACO0K9_08050 [Undibacterium sp. Ji50W]|uniref:hypothetical protein n=1 Tax=Undibacterium sp. Ji50W TaxID=3413041 RepID=UPI003BF3BA01